MKASAGILLYRRSEGRVEVLLVHPGGPFWRTRDNGAWTIPKGEVGEGEGAYAAALREFREETGLEPSGAAVDLGVVRQAGGKQVNGFAIEGDFDPAKLVSNTFEMDWPPRSGKRARFPEVDRAEWFSPEEGRRKINPAQAPFIQALLQYLRTMH